MDVLLDRFLGFMPHHSVFWTAVGTSLVVVIAQYTYQKITKLIELPYEKAENRLRRAKEQAVDTKR